VTELQDRPRFYEGQYLEAADLTAAVEYTRTTRARTLLGAHRWGIAIGMDLTEVPGPNGSLDVVVTPGYAWDGFGRPIVVAEPTKLATRLFAAYDAMVMPGSPPPAPVVVDVWARYDETLAQAPRPGFETCDATSAYARVAERFVLEAGPRPDLASQRDPVEVAGRTIDASQALKTFDPAAPEVVDGSIPHQQLPGEGDRATWLVPLGVVTWQPGSPGRLVQRDAVAKARHAVTRQYVGVVAGSIEAVAGVVRVHDRGAPYSTAMTGELLSVEGDVRSDGDVRIFGHRLEFVASHAENPRAPFHVLRKDDLGAGSADLTLVIGDQQAGHNRLVVARKSGTDASGQDQHQARMVVTDQGRVGIGTEQPLAPLHLAAQGVQIGASSTATDNFHLQSTAGPRALRFFNKDTGTGTPLMSLTSDGRLGLGETAPTNPLHVKAPTGIRQGAMYLSGDSRWSSVTFNAHHNAANNDWEFPDPAKPAVTIEMDAVNGFPRFEVFTTDSGDNQSWRSRLFVHGHTGRVGIGTVNPVEQLEVAGDIRFAGLAAIGSQTKVRVVWGAVSAGGAVDAGDGFTVTKSGTGRYQVTFGQLFSAQPVVLVSRVHKLLQASDGAAVTAAETAVVDQVDPQGAQVATADTSGALADGGFTFIAVGPR
jgi:hypothetical protein